MIGGFYSTSLQINKWFKGLFFKQWKLEANYSMAIQTDILLRCRSMEGKQIEWLNSLKLNLGIRLKFLKLSYPMAILPVPWPPIDLIASYYKHGLITVLNLLNVIIIMIIVNNVIWLHETKISCPIWTELQAMPLTSERRYLWKPYWVTEEMNSLKPRSVQVGRLEGAERRQWSPVVFITATRIL